MDPPLKIVIKEREKKKKTEINHARKIKKTKCNKNPPKLVDMTLETPLTPQYRKKKL